MNMISFLEEYITYLVWEAGKLLRFLSNHLENPEHHQRVMGCNTLTPKDIGLSNIQQTTKPLIARPLSEKS